MPPCGEVEVSPPALGLGEELGDAPLGLPPLPVLPAEGPPLADGEPDADGEGFVDGLAAV